MEKFDNALNESSLALNFVLFEISKSPLLQILNKMSEYSSFNAYIGDAAQSGINDFLPDLCTIRDDKPNI